MTAVGDGGDKFKPGDLAAVGCLVDSCRMCPDCRPASSSTAERRHVHLQRPGQAHRAVTPSAAIRTASWWTSASSLRVPTNLDPAATAPLLCAGITTYSPLRHWKVGPGQKVGIVGLGGLGHMGVKFAHAFGRRTSCCSPPRPARSRTRSGSARDEVVISKNADEMEKHAGTFDFILDAVSADHDINAYLQLLKRDGTLMLVGAPADAARTLGVQPVLRPQRLAGSRIGGIAETQEMLDFCGEHNIASDIEMIPIQQINEAYERLLEAT